MNLSDLPPLRQSLEAAGLLARKSFGQHFLLDLNITRKIVRLADVKEGDGVLEVGPGPGGLTRALLESGARVLAIEKDTRFAPLLAELSEAVPGRLTVLFADALTVGEHRALKDSGLAGPFRVVANLPYNVGTPLLVKWLTLPRPPASLTLMFQKEVAQRIVARPGEAAYGRLAVLAATLSTARIVMDLPARAFTPPPKVDSAVVTLIPLPDPPAQERLRLLQSVTASAFGQRRKMLRSSLKGLGGETLCAAAGVDPSSRAEDLSPDEFMALATAATMETRR